MVLANVDLFLRKHLNFYRVHILTFTFTPLLFSVILWGCNGKFPISYIDSLFLCISAMTVCGLATVDLSALTAWQQVIIFIQMCLGSPVLVSWVIVYIRKYYFAKKFDYIIEGAVANKAAGVAVDAEKRGKLLPKRLLALFGPSFSGDRQENEEKLHDQKKDTIRPEMIRRMDDAPKLVDPSGWISQGPAHEFKGDEASSRNEANRHLSFAAERPGNTLDRRSLDRSTPRVQLPRLRGLSRRLSDPGAPSAPSPEIKTAPIQRFETVTPVSANPQTNVNRNFTRTQTIEFAPSVIRRRGRQERNASEIRSMDRMSAQSPDHRSVHRSSLGVPVSLSTHLTSHTHRSHLRPKHSGFGGFPMPHELIGSLMSRFTPKLKRRLTRTVTIPITTTIASLHGKNQTDGTKSVPYISFDAVVGRNSTFHLLDKGQIEELGGVEYRALNALLWIVASYHIVVQLVAFIVIAPYISTSRWNSAFEPPALHRPLPPPWFALFQAVSAYTNTGMSLVDTSMVPFQQAYPMIVFMMLLILAGNTAFPIFLRFTIWCLSKMVSPSSRANETLHFLLDHPRRCFIYLFPSHQTWFLLTIVIFLNFTDWFFFMVLDIGTPAIESIPLGTRFILGLLQAFAVRAAGFGTVALSALAPAVKVLYVVMMYVSVYPIAMSVRSTNVYEEQSLGIFHDGEETDDDEDDFEVTGSRMTVWSKYLVMHARRQLAFDMWWLGLALFLLCIIERSNLDEEANFGWFNIFSILFELVSAYGTVGLSLGLPTANYSFSGALHPLSKLIVCVVMLRGRHRGLPVAIDRAIMVPSEFSSNRSEYRSDIGTSPRMAGDSKLPNVSDTSSHAPNTENNVRFEMSPNGRNVHPSADL